MSSRRCEACDGGFTVQSGGCGDIDDLPEADQEQIARILARTGDDGAYVLNRLDADGQKRLSALVRQGEMDGQDVKAMARMLRGEEDYVDSSLTADDFLHIGAEGDLHAVHFATKRDGDVVWLEQGNEAAGWEHIIIRHEGQFVDDQSYIKDTDDIQRHIKETLEHGEKHEIEGERGGTAYQLRIDDVGKDDEEFVTVIVGDNGYVVTARPGEYDD